MNKDEWLAAAASLATRQSKRTAAPGDSKAVKLALGELYMLFWETGHAIFDDFPLLAPGDLDHAGFNFSRPIIKNADFSWEADRSNYWRAFRAAAYQLRALDTALHDMRISYARTEDPNGLFALDELQLMVVPRRRPRRITESGAGLSFSRNALVYHRVYPQKLGECALRFKWLDTHDDFPSRDRPLGSAMFNAFKLHLDTTGDAGRFRAKDISCTEPENAIDDQLVQAARDHCFALVWPELSLTPTLQEHVVQGLQRRRDDDVVMPDILVIGSWHEAVGDEFYNEARIIDGYGDPVTSHRKIMPYRGNSLAATYRLEDIARGGEITCLVAEDQIVAVVICRDLCDQCGRSPVGGLDVDLLLVPSHGNARTLGGHQLRATELRTNFGAQVFVVQHATDLPPDLRGYVLQPSDTPQDPANVLRQADNYRRIDQLADATEPGG